MVIGPVEELVGPNKDGVLAAGDFAAGDFSFFSFFFGGEDGDGELVSAARQDNAQPAMRKMATDLLTRFGCSATATAK